LRFALTMRWPFFLLAFSHLIAGFLTSHASVVFFLALVGQFFLFQPSTLHTPRPLCLLFLLAVSAAQLRILFGVVRPQLRDRLSSVLRADLSPRLHLYSDAGFSGCLAPLAFLALPALDSFLLISSPSRGGGTMY